jgi:hypothetical protein
MRATVNIWVDDRNTYPWNTLRHYSVLVRTRPTKPAKLHGEDYLLKIVYYRFSCMGKIFMKLLSKKYWIHELKDKMNNT